jgi:hypothetical protein
MRMEFVLFCLHFLSLSKKAKRSFQFDHTDYWTFFSAPT